MECLMLWLRNTSRSVVLMALLQQHCFNKQTSGMGKQVFWVSVQSSAGCWPPAFLQWVFDASAAGEHWLEPQAIEAEEPPVRSFSLGATSCATTRARGAVALRPGLQTLQVSLMTHRQAVSFESCPISFLFTRKSQRLYGILEIRMMYPKQFWCVSSVYCVGGCAAMHVTVSCVKSGNGGILPSLE